MIDENSDENSDENVESFEIDRDTTIYRNKNPKKPLTEGVFYTKPSPAFENDMIYKRNLYTSFNYVVPMCFICLCDVTSNVVELQFRNYYKFSQIHKGLIDSIIFEIIGNNYVSEDISQYCFKKKVFKMMELKKYDIDLLIIFFEYYGIHLYIEKEAIDKLKLFDHISNTHNIKIYDAPNISF